MYSGWHHWFGRADREVAAAEAEADHGSGDRAEEKGAGSTHQAGQHGQHTQ